MNICLITDESYFMYTLVCIASVCLSNTSIPLNFYVLLNNVSKQNKDILSTFKFKNCKLFTVDIDANKYKNLYAARHLSSSMFIKFDIPNILNNIDKVLYLDGDILVQKSLINLYDTNLKDKFAAVVKDFGMLTIWRNNTVQTIKNNTHFYSGQMLLNLKLLRDKNVSQQLFNNKKQNPKLMDEEIFNNVFKDNVIFIGPEYNVSYEKIISHKIKEYNDINLYNKIYNTHYSSIKELLSNAAIFHFHGNKQEIYSIPTIKCLIDYYKQHTHMFFKY